MNGKIGLWMYCIIETGGEMNWDCLGIHGTSPVFTVTGGDFSAVVSEEPMKKYPLVRDYLMAHQRVNEAVLRTRPVLPVRFCTMAESREKIIEEALIPKTSEFRERLGDIRGKEECGLRVRWRDLDRVFRELGESDEKLRRKKETILSLPESQRRTELIDVGHLVQAAVREKNEGTARALLDALTPLADDFKKNGTLGDAMVLNAAFLVGTEKQEAFDRKVVALDAGHGEALQFKYLAPVPPFNFVELVIRWRAEPVPALQGEKHVSAG